MEPAPPMPRLLHPAEAAALLGGLAVERVIRMCKRRELPSLVLPDGTLLIDAADLVQWLNDRRHPARAPEGVAVA
jgi:hypothetical protein